MNWTLNTQRGPIGLDIGDRWIKAIQLSGDGVRIEAAASIARLSPAEADAPPLAVAEAQRLIGILRRRGFVGRRAVVAVPARSVMTSILELPPAGSGAPRQQIACAELAEAHRREPTGMEVSFWDIPKPARPVEGAPAMAAGCTHGDAEALIDPLQRAGFQIDALDLQSWAVARICTRLSGLQSTAEMACNVPPAAGMIAAVDLGWTSATLMLLHCDTVVYERNLPAAGLRHLATALERSHRFGPDVVEYLLRDLGFGGDAESPDDADLLLKARGQLDAHFDGLGQELRLSISYAQHQYPAAPVDHVVLTGGGAGVPGLADYLAAHIDSPVQSAAATEAIRCDASLQADAASPSLTVAAGLALWNGKEAAQCAA